MKKTIIAIAAASVLLLSACGSDGSTSDTTVAATDSTEMAAKEAGTIVEVAQGNADFSTLVAAITAAGLGDALSGAGPFTVFAPTNAAFEALPAGLLEKLLLPENKEILTKILTYHVVPSKVMAADVAAGDVTTLEGSTFAITTEGGVKVNASNVTATDVAASNGVIHVIDAVLVPASVDITKLYIKLRIESVREFSYRLYFFIYALGDLSINDIYHRRINRGLRCRLDIVG